MTQELITMTSKESTRYDIIQKLLNKEINGTDAAKQIGVSVRQIRNIKSKVKKYGMNGIIHSNRGKPSNGQMSKAKIYQIKRIMEKKYYDFGPTLGVEKLYENHQITISKESLRHLMIKWKIWSPKPRRNSKNRHVWRPRKDNYGELQQFDGSYHHWLENRAGELCLLLSVDDATGKITHAKFDKNESTEAVFEFWLEYFKINGLPISIYLDKFSTYKINHKNAVNNKEFMTQFQRAMQQTEVQIIHANSPEAKGRVERMNKTLQDRLVKDMRLAQIRTIRAANSFLKKYIPIFNSKFAVVANRKKNLHKLLGETTKERLPQIFSRQEERKVLNDYTIMYETQYFQLEEIQPTTVYKKDTVIVEKHLDGSIKINLKGHYLNYVVLPKRPKKEINVPLIALTSKKQSNWKPSFNHPWNRQFLRKKMMTKQSIQVLK